MKGSRTQGGARDLDALLAAADPLTGRTPPSPDAGAARALTELTMSHTNTPIRRRRRVALIGGLSAVLIGAPSAAYALTDGFHTGVFASYGQTEARGGEEILNLSDPSIRTLVKQEIAKVPVPPGTNLDSVLARYPLQAKNGVGTVGQARVIVDDVDGFSQCLWFKDWVAGDAATRQRDAAVIDKIPHWPFAQNFANDGGLKALQDQVAAIDRGDPALPVQFINANC